MRNNYIDRLGSIAIATRLKNLTDRLMTDGLLIYKDIQSDFEPRWFAYLNLLNDRGPLSVTEIADQINQTHPTIIQLAKVLEKKDLIKSEKDENDSRRRILSLSENGRQLVDQHQLTWQAFRAAVDELLGNLDPDFLEKLSQLEDLLQQQGMYSRINQKLLEFEDHDRVEITQYTAQHKNSFYELNKDWLEEFFEIEPRDEFILSHPQEEILDKGGRILFMKKGVRVVGTVAIIQKSQTNCELAKMAVEKDCRMEGFGQLLLSSAIRKALCMGFNRMELFTSPALVAANKLYHKNGFLDIAMSEQELALFHRPTIKMELNLLTKINSL